MCTLQEYEVPREILHIERSKNLLGGTTSKEMAAKLEQKSTMDKSTEKGYVNAFTWMLQFEEAAQSQYVVQFNVKDIRVKRSDSDSEREFCIKHEVSSTKYWVNGVCEFVLRFSSSFFLCRPAKVSRIVRGCRRIGCGLFYIETVQPTHFMHADRWLCENLQQRFHFRRNHRT